jgi:hypothetical protein
MAGMAVNEASRELQQRAAAIEREVTALRERLHTARATHAEHEAELARQPARPRRSRGTTAKIVLLPPLVALAALAFAMWDRGTLDGGCPPEFVTRLRPRSDVFEASYSGVVRRTDADGAGKVGDRCIIRLVGMRYGHDADVEHVSLSCVSGQAGTTVSVYDSADDGDSRDSSPQSSTGRTNYVDVTSTPAAITYVHTWHSQVGSGAVEIDTTTHKARFQTKAEDAEREWLLDLTEPTDKSKGAP